jgi:hypothetical protein
LIDQDEGGVEVTSPNADGIRQSVIVRELGERLRLAALNLEIGLEEAFARARLSRFHARFASHGRLLKPHAALDLGASAA